MGLKIDNYHVNDINVTLPTAYAQITHLSVNVNGVATAMFAIQQTRGLIATNEAIETKHIRCSVDKEQPIFAQVYTKAKETLFEGWQDDIVVSE